VVPTTDPCSNRAYNCVYYPCPNPLLTMLSGHLTRLQCAILIFLEIGLLTTHNIVIPETILMGHPFTTSKWRGRGSDSGGHMRIGEGCELHVDVHTEY